MTIECQEEELRQREICDFTLYVITPKMTGVYSIAELIDDCHRKGPRTIFCFLEEDEGLGFKEGPIRSLTSVGKMVARIGGLWFENLDEVANFLNSES